MPVWLGRQASCGGARRGVLLALAAVVLAGCAGLGPRAAPGSLPDPAGEHFSLEGRVSVRFGDENLSGRIAWAHARDTDEINLASPLGNQLAQIVRDAGGVLLVDSQQQRHRAPDAETLTERQLGWRLPLGGLVDWVRGRPSAAGAGETGVARDAAGRLTRLDEAGWVIEFSYDGDAARLPRRLIMNYSRGEKPLEIRLVVDTWSA